MSMNGLDLFELVPALYRLKDAQLAQSQVLLTPAEQSTVATLQAKTTLTPEKQAELDQLLAKAARGPLQSLLMIIQEQLAVMA
ncbi:MAG TPA: hypothetical protein VFP71_10285, partial [Candidatus Angelobacter sp.]|nr:hypothetical protein [Candidatus Angelobacter sp.]